MTDTVNVPREADGKIATAISDAVRRFCIGATDGSVCVDNGIARQIWSAAIAAAPKAEACALHKVHGIHLDPCCPYCPDPEAPKVEQEPVWERERIAAHQDHAWLEKWGMPDTHPAPASDDLLAALEIIAHDRNKVARVSDARYIAAHAIAKHKGPQS